MDCEKAILEIWDKFSDMQYMTESDMDTVLSVMNMLDKGEIRVASEDGGVWVVNQWVKKGILLSFKVYNTTFTPNTMTYDKIPLKFANWQEKNFMNAGIRVVSGAIVRYSAYIGKNVVIMPSLINVGAYIDEGTMIDSYVTVGSAAQIGKRCHISMQVGIGGVLEPIQSAPTIIEDDVFIGAGSNIAEGVIVARGAVIGSGVSITGSTKIYNKATKEIHYGYIPPYSVVIGGSLPDASGNYCMNAAIIIKQVDASTRMKTQITELLR